MENKIKNSDNIIRSTWKLINNEIKESKHVYKETNLVKNGILHKEPKEVCEIFNNHFVSVVDSLIALNPLAHSISSCGGKSLDHINTLKFNIKPVSEGELRNIILSFPNKYSSGYDEIPMPVIKNSVDLLIKPLMHVINSSFISGIFPPKLKTSKIKTVFKKGNQYDPENYRPLSIVPTISKIFEKAMLVQLINYLESNNLFDDYQHGFRSGKSVVTAGIDLIETIVDTVDCGDNAVGIFMDLRKAFDSVSHGLLLEVLTELGISGVSLKWFKSYLLDRQQFVELTYLTKNNQLASAKSTILNVKHGVPQGTILGPILFICYLKGLSLQALNSNSRLCLYADDCNLILKSKMLQDIESKLKDNIIKLQNYFNNKQLFINFEKTNFISFQTRQNQNKFKFNLNIDNHEIKQLESTKFLGLTIDANLSWDKHIQSIQKKIASGLFALRSMAKFCSDKLLKYIYFSHIHSHISFGIELYGSTSNENLQSILIMQKKQSV